MAQSRLLVVLALSLSALTLSVFPPQEDSLPFQAALIILSLASAVAFFALRHRKSDGWATITFLFVVGYVIVNLNVPILRLIGLEPSAHLKTFIWSSREVQNTSVAISATGLAFFLLGSTIGKKKSPPPNRPSNSHTYRAPLLPYITIGFLLLFIASSGSYIYGEYTPDDASALSTYFYKLFKVSLTAAILVKVYHYFVARDEVRDLRTYLSLLGTPLILTLSFFLALSLVVGDRGPLLYYTLLIFGPYLGDRNRVGFLKAAAFAYCASLLFSLIGIVRQARFSGKSLFERWADTTSDNSIMYSASFYMDQPVFLGHTLELGASVRALNHAIANVPSEYGFGYGFFSFQQILSIVPGLSGIVNSIFLGGDWRTDGSANFITYLIQGNFPTYGDGTSATAELYLDFGFPGVVIGLFAFGLFAGRYEGGITRGDKNISFTWVCVLIYFANSIYLARSSLLLDLSDAILVYGLIKITAKPIGPKNKQPSFRRRTE